MCVTSMVHDDFSKRIPGDFQPPPWFPSVPPIPAPGSVVAAETLFKPLATAEQVETLRQEVAALRQLILDFREATKAAAIVDRLTKQPDCVDPEKAELEERVRELESKLAAVSAAIGA